MSFGTGIIICGMLKLRNIHSIFGDWWKVVYSIDKGRENTKNSGSIGIKESVCRSVKDNGRRVLRSHDFSFLLIFPILSTIPNLLHTFSVHLMNCYFSDFWYSHVTEKRTLRREKCNMRKKQDIIWKQSTRWKLVEKWVTKYLDSYHTLFCWRCCML